MHLLTVKPAYAAMLWQNLFVGLWRGLASPESAVDFGRLFIEARRLCPDGYGTLLIFEANIPLPDAATRKGLLETMNDAPEFLFLGGVIESTGLGARTLRGVIQMMSLWSSKKYPQATFETIDAFCDWAEGRLNHRQPESTRCTSGDIGEAIRRFRQSVIAA